MAPGYLAPINEMREQIERMFNSFNEESGFPMSGRSDWMNREIGNWMPPVEISETEEEVCVNVALPGVKPEDINVEVTNNALVLSGETRREVKQNEQRFHRSEFQYGRFMRRITLPDDVQGDACTAEFDNGMLQIHLPKSENTTRKRIAVKTS